MTVPASPQSTSAGPRSGVGVIVQSSVSVSMPTPRACRAPAMSTESRDRSARRTTEGPSERAARTRARLVRDLEPGSRTVVVIGAAADGAGHRAGGARPEGVAGGRGRAPVTRGGPRAGGAPAGDSRAGGGDGGGAARGGAPAGGGGAAGAWAGGGPAGEPSAGGAWSGGAWASGA